MSESMYNFFFLLALVILILGILRQSGMAMFATAGAVLGLATLTRPNSQFFPVIIFFCLIIYGWKRQKVRESIYRCSLFIIVFFLVLSPWMIRNQRYFGTFELSSAGTWNLFDLYGGSLLEMRDISDSDLYLRDQLQARGVEVSYDGVRYPPYWLTESRFISRIIFGEFVAHPSYTFRTVSHWFGEFFFGQDWRHLSQAAFGHWMENVFEKVAPWQLSLEIGLFLLMIAGGIVGLKKSEIQIICLFLFLAILYVALTGIGVQQIKTRTAVLPVMSIFVVEGGMVLFRGIKKIASARISDS